MLTCPNCGGLNPLGHVFCDVCGRKLTMEDSTQAEWIEVEKRATLRRRVVGVVHGVFGLLLLGSLALALWPMPVGSGDTTMEAAIRCRWKLDAFAQAARNGNHLEAEFPESELNAYVKRAILRHSEGRAALVRVGEKKVHVRWWIRLRKSPGFSPVMSFDVTLLPSVLSGRMWIADARMGHLSLGWPFKGTVQRVFLSMCSSRMEWPLVRQLRVTRCTQGAVAVSTPDDRMEAHEATSMLEKELPPDVEPTPDPLAVP